MSPLDFRCSVNQTSLFCLNGGVCTEAGDPGHRFLKCLCPPGVQHDFTMSHLQNCGLRENELLGVFITLTIEFSLAIFYLLFLAFYRARAQVARILKFNSLYLLSNWLYVLCVYLESGLFLSATIFVALAQVLLTNLVFRMTKIATQPVFKVIDRSKADMFLRKVEMLEYSLIALQLVVMVPVMVTVSMSNFDSNPFNVNLTLNLSWVLSAIGAIITFLMLGRAYKQLGDFFRSLDLGNMGLSGDLLAQRTEILKRIDAQRKYSRTSIFTFSGVLVLPILFLSMGSIPYQIWIWLAFIMSIPLHVLSEARHLAGQKQTGSKGSKTQSSSKGEGTATLPTNNKHTTGAKSLVAATPIPRPESSKEAESIVLSTPPQD